MPGTHEDLFALLATITDPVAFKTKLKKLDDTAKVATDERKTSEAAREEAAANNKAAQKALADAKEVEAKAATDRAAAQDRKDKADLALAETKQLGETLKIREQGIVDLERKQARKDAELLTREENLSVKERAVAARETELNAKFLQLKQIAT